MATHQDECTNKRKYADFEQQRCEGIRVSGRGKNDVSSSNEAYGRGYPREDTPPAQCSVLCGPRSCSTLPSSVLGSRNDCGASPPEPKRRRMWGLRGLVKIFRRRVRRKGGTDPSESPNPPPPAIRARSASELTIDPANRNSGGGPYNQGLSVSHDSVFSPESPTEQTRTTPSGLALAARGVNMCELKEALRRRRGIDSTSVDDDFDDPGLPRSPQTSPTTLDVLNHGLKSSSCGAQSSCSDGSLLSMGSSENDEDSFGVLSHHSSKYSLIENRHHQIVDHEPAVGAAPLSHKAARHKISVRPKRTHGIPRARKQTQILPSSLPVTPEVNEDSNLRSEKLNLSTTSEPTPESYIELVGNQRPTSISYSSDTRVFRREDQGDNRRRAQRKSLPNPSSYNQEEKKDHFLNHLFGSVNSYNSEKDNYPVISDSLSSDGERLSRESCRDQFRPPIGTKSSRQKSDPSRFTYTDETTVDRCSSQRSSSVEGRLEGNLLQKKDSSFVRESILPPLEFELEKELASKLVSFDETSVSSRTDVNPSRLSSSFDNLNDDYTLPSLSSYNQIGLCTDYEGRSSTDSLTTTPLPGIYIRSNQISNKFKNPCGINENKERHSRFKEEQLRNQMDLETTGPLSLDSSLNLVQHVEEFRKTISASEVPFSKGAPENLIDNSVIFSSRPASVMRSVSVNSPASSSRANSFRSRKSSIGDELESDSSLSKVSLRKVKRELSFKNSSENQDEKVPEFLKIQLNRVQNKGGSIVVFGTDQKYISNTNRSTIVHVREWSDVSQREYNVVTNIESEKPRDQSEIIVGGKNLVEVNKNEIEEKKSLPKINNHESDIRGSKKINKKKPIEELSHKDEEIVLRRPSVVDRSIVIDQSMGASPSLPTVKGDEPELFKVFARRSFKLKDPEMESSLVSEQSDLDKENYLPDSSYNELICNQQKRPEHHSTTPIFSLGSVVIPSFPVLKNVTCNRYSCGNVNTVSPHASILSSNVISNEEGTDSKIITSQRVSPIFKRKLNDAEVNNTELNSHVYTHHQIKKIENQEPDTSNLQLQISEKNEDDLHLVQDQKASCSKHGLYNQKTNQAIYFDNNSSTKNDDQESLKSDNYIRRSINPNQNEIFDGCTREVEQNVKIPKMQAVVWQQRSQLLGQSSESDVSRSSLSSFTSSIRSSAITSTPHGRVSLPNSKILNSFKERHSPSLCDDVESQSSDSNEASSKRHIYVDNRRKSLKETATSSSSLLAEARNTMGFTHSFDNSSPLALSYLGRGETSLKLSRKGSVDEPLKSTAVVEDWRILVKQRREDRMKHTKTPEAEEIIIETRPAVSRNSKVLEMANNFQKLQVA